MIELKELSKVFQKSDHRVEVLKEINHRFDSGFHVVMGASGSGKTTLLQIMAGIQKPTEGKVKVKGKNLRDLKTSELAEFRNRNIGFVYQTFNLLDYLTALENVMVPMIPIDTDKNRALKLLEKVGIKDRARHTPKELSGGEKQRVGIARALANDPDIILADEPTGNLDHKTSKKTIDALREAVGNRTLILATHDRNIVEGADTKVKLLEGKFERID